MSAYQELEKIFRKYNGVNGANAILGWDNATMLPENSGPVRGEQSAVLAEIAHELITTPQIEELLEKAHSQIHDLNEWQHANLREMKRSWQHQNAVPADLVSALSKACHESELYWRKARADNDWKSFLPHQKKVLALVRESAQAKSEAMGLSPYDALIDQFDPGTSCADIDPVFDELAAFLPDFIQNVIDKQASELAPLELEGPFDTAIQKKLGLRLMKQLGFDFTRGRLDESTHPFCGGVPGDIRLTTRYNNDEFLSSMFGVLHETGHALYEMGLPEQWHNQPVGEARGMAFHESQSLLVEMQLAINPDFLHYAAPLIRQEFGKDGDAWSADNIYKNVTRVSRSLIRVDADEVTYPAHVIMRYRIEKQLISGELEAKDIPQAWASHMRDLLGVTPDSDGNGCMQDVHWPDGLFGYFPSYTLGAMIAAQLFDTANKHINGLSEHIRKGEFAPLTTWLRNNVHSQASCYTSKDLLKKVTGQPLSTDIYKNHLTTRYLS